MLFYHSSTPKAADTGIAGIAEVASHANPDATQFDPTSPYHDPKSTPAAPRWLHVDVRLVRQTRLLPLAALRADPALATMRLLAPGSRLSITPVSAAEWQHLQSLL